MKGKGIFRELVCTFILLCLPLGEARAAVIPENNQAGSVTVTMFDAETLEPVSGGDLTLYRVGRVKLEDGTYMFTLTKEFEDMGISLEDLNSAQLSSPRLARELADFARQNDIAGITLTIGESGCVVYDMVLNSEESNAGLPNGVYLFSQDNGAEGYYTLDPFLVTIPVYDTVTETYQYEIDATPKTQAIQRDPDAARPEETEPEESEPETRPEETEPEESGPETRPVETEPEESEPETRPEENEIETGPDTNAGTGHHSGGSSNKTGGSGTGARAVTPETGAVFEAPEKAAEGEYSDEWALAQAGQSRAVPAMILVFVISGLALVFVLYRRLKKKRYKALRKQIMKTL